MKKWLVAIVFSVLLLVPVVSQNAFAGSAQTPELIVSIVTLETVTSVGNDLTIDVVVRDDSPIDLDDFTLDWITPGDRKGPPVMPFDDGNGRFRFVVTPDVEGDYSVEITVFGDGPPSTDNTKRKISFNADEVSPEIPDVFIGVFLNDDTIIEDQPVIFDGTSEPNAVITIEIKTKFALVVFVSFVG